MVGFKNRYMVVEVILDPNRELVRKDPVIITSYNVTKAIRDSILVNFGECGLASSLGSFQVKYVNDITRMCIIRASRDEYQKVWAAITMVRSIADCPVLFNLLDLSSELNYNRSSCGWLIFFENAQYLIHLTLEFSYCARLKGSIKACKETALKCDESKFEQHKLLVGSNLSAQDTQKMQYYLDKIKGLEH